MVLYTKNLIASVVPLQLEILLCEILKIEYKTIS